MLLTPEALKHQVDSRRACWLGFSGGLDSTVLLHLLCAAGVAFRAVHVNHQLSPNAGSWEVHCRQVCAALGVPIDVLHVQVQGRGRGLEAAAREARYRAIGSLLADTDQLLTGHHQNDQAETLLLRLMRGAGPTGLAAMRQAQTLVIGARSLHLTRPLLGATRAELLAYAEAHRLRWIEDESNADTGFDRNFVRTDILPRLSARWPTAVQRLAQTAALCASNQQLIDEVAAEDLARLAPTPPTGMGWPLPLAALQTLSDARRVNLLRFWMARWPLQLDQRQLRALWQQVVNAAGDAEARLVIGDSEFRRFSDSLWLLPRQCPAPAEAKWLAPGDRLPWGNGELWLETCEQGLKLPSEGRFRVVGRAGGERCRPEGRAHSQTLKKLLQSAGLAPWLRDQLPLLYRGDQLCAVADLWCETGAEQASPGYRLRWQLPQNPWPF